jgi:hypothetical protein
VLCQQSALAEGFRCCPYRPGHLPSSQHLGSSTLMMYFPAMRSAKQPPTASHISCCSCSASSVITDFPDSSRLRMELHKIALALAGVAENEDVGGGLVLVALVEVHEDVAAVLVPPDVEALCVRFAGIVEGIEVGHELAGQDTLELRPKALYPLGPTQQEALLLTEQEPVHIELAPHQFRQHIGLEQLQRVISEAISSI